MLDYLTKDKSEKPSKVLQGMSEFLKLIEFTDRCYDKITLISSHDLSPNEKYFSTLKKLISQCRSLKPGKICILNFGIVNRNTSFMLQVDNILSFSLKECASIESKEYSVVFTFSDETNYQIEVSSNNLDSYTVNNNINPKRKTVLSKDKMFKEFREGNVYVVKK